MKVQTIEMQMQMQLKDVGVDEIDVDIEVDGCAGDADVYISVDVNEGITFRTGLNVLIRLYLTPSA